MAPITEPSLPPCTSNAAERTTACCQPLLPTSSTSPARRLLSTKEPAASRPSDAASARDCPGAKLWAPTVAAAPSSNQLLALKSLQPWPQLGPNARSKSLQPSAPRRPFQAEQLRAQRPLAKPKRARLFQSSAVKLWAQASAAATFTRQTLLRLNLLQPQRSASTSE